MSSAAERKTPVFLEQVLKQYASELASENTAVQAVMRGLLLVGVGLRPALDHFIFRTLHLKGRADEFLAMGYERDPETRALEHKGHSVEVFRKRFAPSILLEHPHEKTGLEWVAHFGDKKPYAMALRVDNIEEAVFHLEKQSIPFMRPPAGKQGETLREIASVPQVKDGRNAHCLILVERHGDDCRFYSPDFWVHPVRD